MIYFAYDYPANYFNLYADKKVNFRQKNVDDLMLCNCNFLY